MQVKNKPSTQTLVHAELERATLELLCDCKQSMTKQKDGELIHTPPCYFLPSVSAGCWRETLTKAPCQLHWFKTSRTAHWHTITKEPLPRQPACPWASGLFQSRRGPTLFSPAPERWKPASGRDLPRKCSTFVRPHFIFGMLTVWM